MYLQRLELVNCGPIEHANIECRFGNDGTPNPIILVGANGSGKSIATSHIVSALIAAHGSVFEDSDVEEGKVFKLRSPAYVRHGADYSTATVHLSGGFYVFETQLQKMKNQFLPPFPNYAKWDEVKPTDFSHYSSNFHQQNDALKSCLNEATHLFFPPNRFEEPAWLNEVNLRNKANYPSLKSFTNISNRPIVNHAPMRNLQDWILDLLYDCHVLETTYSISTSQDGIGGLPSNQIVRNRNGAATNILKPIEDFLRALFGKNGSLSWHVGRRNQRTVGLSINGSLVTENLFQLSTGQSVLLDLFLTIIRDFDLSLSTLSQLSDIKGTVVVDEIDLHLHADLQHDILPRLIHLFPKVQFILTTHSPLFLIGMEKIFTSEGFQLVELPTGQEIEVERFSEFEAAYKHMQESARFREEVRHKIAASRRPALYLEGATDIDYIRKAAELLGKTDLVDGFELRDSVGAPHMNKLWETLRGHLGDAIQQKWILLYDCDQDKPADNSRNLFRRQIPKQAHKIENGIENLFPDSTIARAKEYKLDFVDVTDKHTTTMRGVLTEIPETWNVNRCEKRNLCDWLCENGTADDFRYFSLVFDILEEVLRFEVPQ
jgi:hypothetical protein